MKQIDISVVVCTYNRAEMLRFALESLIWQDTDGKFTYEILVIDDNSTDGTNSVVTEISSRSEVPIRYVCEGGHGIGCARNRGIRESFGEWVAFFDDDELAERTWLRELFTFASKTGCLCIGGKVCLFLSGHELSRLSSICRRILGETMNSTKPEKCRRKAFPGCGNVLIKATVFNTVGKFDESLTRGGEDLVFFSNVRRAGLAVWYTPRAIVHHMIPSYRLKARYFFWNSIRVGHNFAYRDYLEWGLGKTMPACIARIGQALLVNVPFLLWAHLLGDNQEKVGRKCLLWRAVGYTSQTLHLLAPRAFALERFFAQLDFRRERQAFQNIPEFNEKRLG